ncbi:MAG: iron-sulfur cluster assembly scaffold protein, partial [Thermoprotei archaeon]
MSEMYAENILYHYQNPSNKGVIPEAQVKIEDTNVLCGDKVALYAKLSGDKIERLTFEGSGC